MNNDNKFRRLRVSGEDMEIYDYLRSVEPFSKLKPIDIFALALIFGKKEGIRTPLNGKKSDIISPVFIEGSNIHSLMKAISFEETGSLEVLDDRDEYFTICEEYAKTGFSLLDEAFFENPNSFLEDLELEAMEYYKIIEKTV